jgi:hypothetical protein
MIGIRLFISGTWSSVFAFELKIFDGRKGHCHERADKILDWQNGSERNSKHL